MGFWKKKKSEVRARPNRPPAEKRQFSIRYKFLAALMIILISALSVFFYFSYQTFREDKIRFITDLNLTVLKSVTSELEADFRRRIYELQSLIPILYDQYRGVERSRGNVFKMLSPDLRKEVMSITFYRKDTRKNFISKGGYTYYLREDIKRLVKIREYTNFSMLAESKFPAYVTSEINKQHPLVEGHLDKENQISWLNRSVRIQKQDTGWDIPVLTLVFRAKMVGGRGDSFIIAVDMNQEFLRKKLQESDLAEMFLIQSDGRLISHGDLDTTLDFADRYYDHPLLERFKDNQGLPRESLEIKWEGHRYLASFGVTGFGNIYLVSQIRKSAAFAALRLLVRQFVFLALTVVCLAIIVTVLLAGRLTFNIGKLKKAAEQIGRGDLSLKLNINTNDEIQSVGETMEWMSRRISVLLEESAERARMKGELETAQLVQSTLLSNPAMADEEVDVASYYAPATECGGDFVDAFRHDSKVTVLIGDATGHGVSAALLTAVAKSFTSTFEEMLTSGLDRTYSVEELMKLANAVIYKSCRGQLLMTMALLELDTATGELNVCNAGHEAPLRLVREELDGHEESTSIRRACVSLFARGERLGFSPDTTYKATKYQLAVGDSVLLYTDGITETVSPNGKQWGERALKRILVRNGEASIGELKMEIAEAVTTHRSDAEQKDDITFILLRWKGRARKAA